MSWDRREFLKALAGLVAATGVDPQTIVAPLLDAPLVEIKAALAHYSVRIGTHVFPLLQVAAPRLSRNVIDIDDDQGHVTTLGPLRAAFSMLTEGDVPTELLDGAKRECEMRMGPGGPTWTFEAYVSALEQRDGEEATRVEVMPSGAITWTEGGGKVTRYPVK
jgi:hypothetical protein